MGERKLAGTVYIDGEPYAAGTVPPPEVAARITNPKAWAEDEPAAESSPAGVEGSPAGAQTPVAPQAPATGGDEPKPPARKASSKRG